jgi:hypothetical protein
MDEAVFARLIRPVLDRVYLSLRRAAAPAVRAMYAARGLEPGLESDVYFALLDHPVPDAAVAAINVYREFDADAERRRGVVALADGRWSLTDEGRTVASALAMRVGAGAGELWSRRPIPTMPGTAVLPRLDDVVGRLLEAGRASGGPAFLGVTPVYAAEDAATSLTMRLGALRHHRADAHRAAWAAAGLTAETVVALPDGPVRQAVEDDTDRRDAPIYAALSATERLELLAGLAALPDGIAAR